MKFKRRTFLGSLAAIPFLRLEAVEAARVAPPGIEDSPLYWSDWVTLPDGGAVGYWLADLGGMKALINPVIVGALMLHGDGAAVRDALKEDARKETISMVERSHARRKKESKTDADVPGSSRIRRVHAGVD